MYPFRHRIATALLPGVITFALVLSASGCGSPAVVQVNPEKAQQTLEAVLASWKAGEKPADWEGKSPKVVVQDFDWTSGAKLKDFQLLGPGEPRDANLICKVKLVMEKAPKGKKKEQTVTYVVGTEPVLTVFRDSLQ